MEGDGTDLCYGLFDHLHTKTEVGLTQELQSGQLVTPPRIEMNLFSPVDIQCITPTPHCSVSICTN